MDEELEYLKQYLQSYTVKEDGYAYGYYEGDFKKFIEGYMALNSRFVLTEHHQKGTNKRYSKTDSPFWEHKRGHIPITFHGHPCQILGSEMYHCVHGPKKDARGSWKKSKPDNDSKHDDHDYTSTWGKKKLNCPATIQCRKVMIYNDYHVDSEKFSENPNRLRMAKERVMKELQKKLKEGVAGSTSVRNYVRMALSSVHLYHPVGEVAGMDQSINKRIVHKINKMVGRGVINTDEINDRILEYVDNQLFRGTPTDERPKPNNRRYYPTKLNIRNQIGRAIATQKYCKDDQEALQLRIKEWQEKTQTHFFFRPIVAEERFLFVHQEPWQKRLLQLYGSEVVFMDATYKTTKYAIPLFFLWVKTNSDYTVLAEFFIQQEDKESINEALGVIKSWNPLWQPKYFMVDFSLIEIRAIEEQFAGITVYICDFHRVQAWQRWAKRDLNGLNPLEQEELLSHLKHIANSPTKESFENSVFNLKELSIYKEKHSVRNYVDNIWLSCAFRWVKYMRMQQVLDVVNTNNGLEAQSKAFKYDLLPRSIEKSVFGMSVILVENYIPQCYQKYCQRNVQLSHTYRKCNSVVPLYLRDRPPHFIKHCLKAKFSSSDISESDVSCVNIKNGIFNVRSSLQYNHFHEVNFQEPKCTCKQWEKYHYPCKHFFGVFNFFGNEWNFNSLPTTYRDSVFIKLDNELVSNDSVYTTVNNLQPRNLCQQNSINDELSQQSGQDPLTEVISLPEEVYTTNLRHVFQEKLKLLYDFSHMIDDVSILTSSIALLDEVAKALNNVYSKEKQVPPQHKKHKKKAKKHKYATDLTEDDDSIPSKKSRGDSADRAEPATCASVQSTNLDLETIHVDETDITVFDPAVFDRIKQVSTECKLLVTDIMLLKGPNKVTVGDLWTLIPPSSQTAKEVRNMKERIPNYNAGWLTSTIIESYLWKIQLNKEMFFAADTTVFQLMNMHASTQRLWRDVNFEHTQIMVIPFNTTQRLWTLFVVDTVHKQRFYLDPLSSKERRFSNDSKDQLSCQILNMSNLIDLKTGWKCIEWPCTEPPHFHQQDAYNCGVIICLFARCLANNIDLNGAYSMFFERERIASAVLGSCYNDIIGRNTDLCKICRKNEGDDWLSCDSCGQFFHADCLGVNLGEILAQPFFFCPR